VSPQLKQQDADRDRDSTQVGSGRAIELGRAVREQRLATGLTQNQLAELTGIDQGSLSRLEAGVHVPTIAVLDRIADALQVTLTVQFRAA
jgi:transcriptional regulator with XRE-family HTH domain